MVTGTPPYKKPGTATPSPDPQRAHARIELRGGVEEYLAAAALVLAPLGTFVVCMESEGRARVERGATAAGLALVERLDVIPIAGRKGRLFSVFTLSRRYTAASRVVKNCSDCSVIGILGDGIRDGVGAARTLLGSLLHASPARFAYGRPATRSGRGRPPLSSSGSR